jgi:hypothetical protein
MKKATTLLIICLVLFLNCTKQGTSGTSGANGKNGTNGVNGTNGINGINGTQGTNATVKTYSNITLSGSSTYTFNISQVTQAIIDSGSVIVELQYNSPTWTYAGYQTQIGMVVIQNPYSYTFTYPEVKITIIP